MGSGLRFSQAPRKEGEKGVEPRGQVFVLHRYAKRNARKKKI
jgi:hypothetical protein